MMEKRKRVTAAIAAVTAYLQYEHEAASTGMPGVVQEAAPVPAAPVKLWGLSGRQAQMQNRTLMQMRAF